MPIDITSEDSLLRQRGSYIGGAFFTSADETLCVLDPATGETLVELPSFGAREAAAAVHAAASALDVQVPAADRRRWLKAIASAHAESREQLAQIITLENGKPIAEARGEVDYAATFYEEAASRLSELDAQTLERTPRNHRWTTHLRPAGVAALITPWNFPLAMLAKKVSGALAAGAPIVAKPAEVTPLSAIALFCILDRLPLPKGMVNLVFGDAPAIGKVFCEDPAVRVISFTGSTAVGKLLSAQAAPHVKRMALELGGNAPFIVFEDADLELAADHLLKNKFRCAGQTCVCTNRVYIQSSVANRFAELLTNRMRKLRVGPGIDPETDLGPLINKAGYRKVHELVTDAMEQGAEVVLGGVETVPPDSGPMFYPPTLLSEVTRDMRCVKEEIFGPVIPLVRFESEEEVVIAANATEYGLAAYLFSMDKPRCDRIVSRLRFGHVAVNSGTGPTAEAPFGGMKQSGIGREGGVEGILEFLEQQTIAAPLDSEENR